MIPFGRRQAVTRRTLEVRGVKTAADVKARLDAQLKEPTDDPRAEPFVVLIYREGGALTVSDRQRASLANALHAQAAIHEFLILSNPGAADFKELDVEPSTPKLLLFWRRELQHPVWLLDPEEPNLAEWIAALKERDAFPGVDAGSRTGRAPST
jgi:hypothetical protein